MTANSNKSAMFAALAILLGFGLLFFIMPTITLWLAEHYSVWVAAVFDTLAVLAFFLVFWLRARYQRKH
jgi:ABC-type transport system involved in multi-copper enzyme maturation permease subunit